VATLITYAAYVPPPPAPRTTPKLLAPAVPDLPGEVTAPFTGEGALTATLTARTTVTALFTGAGSLAAAYSSGSSIPALFTASGSLTATVTTHRVVTAPFTADCALTAPISAHLSVTAPFTADGALFIAAMPTAPTQTTAIILRPTWIAEDGTEPILPVARYFIRPTHTYAGPSGQVLNIFGPPITVLGAPVTITLDASSGGAGPYQFQLRFRDIDGNDIVRSQYSTVPDGGTVNLEQLVSLNPETLT
jgi:hypothetical protein